MPETALITLLLAGSLLAPAPAPADADVNVGIRNAPQTLASTPRLVALSSSPVFHARHEPYTLLAYAGLYYRLHGGSWFRSTGPGNAWRLIATDRVPNAVLTALPTFAKASALSFAATATPTR